MIQTVWSRFVIAGIVSLAFVPRPTAAGGADELAWKFSPRQRLKLTVVDEIKTVALQAGQAFEIPQERTLEADWRVTSVSPDGHATIELTLTRLRLNSRAPFTGEIDFDSRGVDPAASERVQEVQALFAQVVGLKLSFVMSAEGVVSEMSWDKELPTDLQSQPLIAGLLQLGELQTAVSSGGQLPNQPLERGKTWSYETSRETPGGSLIFATTLARPADEEQDSSQVQLALTANVRLDAPPTENAVVFRVKESQISGEVTFDRKRGVISKANRQQRFTLVVEKDGMIAEQKVSRSTRFALTLNPKND